MNKDLMMKAAVKYKGVWPDDNSDLIIATPSELVFGKTEKDGSVSYVIKGVDENTFLRSWQHCTREQFDDFVESLFEGAPEGATHYGLDGLFYCLDDIGLYYSRFSSHWEVGINGKEWLPENLIPRPAKKVPIIGDTPEQLKDGVKPQAPYIPQIGETCEVKEAGEWTKCTFLLLNICGNNRQQYLIRDEEGNAVILYQEDLVQFRPLRTDREQFIERCTTDYLDRVGSDAINEKWFGRIFGAMYDSGCRYLQS